MVFDFLIKGLIIGFSIAAPVGPIAVLCMQKTLRFGRLSGFFSGLGAAVADAAYGAVAAFGLTFVSNFLLEGQFWLRLIGGIFLIYFGIKIFLSKPLENKSSISHKTLVGDFVSTFFLTIVNPMTIFSYLAVFAGIGLSVVVDNYTNATMFVVGVFFGSTLWWLILSEGINLFRKKVSQKVLTWINRLAGIVIIAFGIVASKFVFNFFS